MCYSPIHIVNPSKYIDPSGSQPLFIDVPCGHCGECIVSYRNEWRNRAYYETLDCFLNDGYVLFDTLTYRNGNLPHLSDWLNIPRRLDFPCFNHDHIRRFVNLLRTRLYRMGFVVYEKLRYFVACEYGDDIRYTRRPHYHILFFVPSEISPKVLSKTISDCWIHGRTDGVIYRGLSYVLSNNVFFNLSESQRFSVNYVTKYCTKQFSYNDLVQSRLNKLILHDFDTYLLAKQFVCGSHWQSKGFGNDSLIKIVGRDYLLENGHFKIMQKNGLFRFVNLHKSLQRKLLYDVVRDENNNVSFRLNSDGFKYKKKFYFRSIEFLVNRIAALNNNLYQEVKNQVFEYFFKDNRFSNYESVDDIIDHSYNISTGLRNYCSVDYSFIRKSIFTGSDFGSKKIGFKTCGNLIKVTSIPRFNSSEYITLNDLKKNVFKSDLSYIDKYFTDKHLKGDGVLSVLKLVDRLNHLFKNQYCYA